MNVGLSAELAGILGPALASFNVDDPRPHHSISNTPIPTTLEQSMSFSHQGGLTLFYCDPHWLGITSKNFFIAFTCLSGNLSIPIAQSTPKLINLSNIALSTRRPSYRTFMPTAH
jgi:hypothetical protein